MLSVLLLILIIVFLSLLSAFVPTGHEKSAVRRLPWVTFSIMAINVVVFYLSFPVVADQQDGLIKLGAKIEQFMKQHQQLLADPKVRKDLVDIGLISRYESDAILDQLRKSPELEAEYRQWLDTLEAQRLREELDQKLTEFKNASQDTFWNKYGLAPNGKWKPHQLI